MLPHYTKLYLQKQVPVKPLFQKLLCDSGTLTNSLRISFAEGLSFDPEGFLSWQKQAIEKRVFNGKSSLLQHRSWQVKTPSLICVLRTPKTSLSRLVAEVYCLHHLMIRNLFLLFYVDPNSFFTCLCFLSKDFFPISQMETHSNDCQ